MCISTNLGFAQQTEQLTALNKVHDHVQILGILEGAPKSDEEGMLYFLQHAALVVGVLDLLHLDNLSLFEHLDGIETLVMLGLYQVDTAETAGTQRAVDGEVIECVLALGLAHRVCDGLGLIHDPVGHVRRVVRVFGLCGWLVDDVLDARGILLRLLLCRLLLYWLRGLLEGLLWLLLLRLRLDGV